MTYKRGINTKEKDVLSGHKTAEFFLLSIIFSLLSSFPPAAVPQMRSVRAALLHGEA